MKVTDATAKVPGGRKDDRRLLAALAMLTFATGLVDAASVLGLGHIFTANMTGNIVFLGFSLVHAGSAGIWGCTVALGAFFAGAALGGGLAAKGRSFTLALAIEVAILGVAFALMGTRGDSGAVSLFVVALLALAMGVQNASARKLAVPDMTTTVLTMSITGLAADSSLAGGHNPRLARRVASVLLLLSGALLGALLLRHGLAWAIGVATLVVAVACLASRPSRVAHS